MILFPFTRDGRQTLIYLVFALAGPALTAVVIWAMVKALEQVALWATFRDLALIVAAALMVVVIGLAMFVSIRAIKVGRDGVSAEGEGGGE
jgi:lysylphosphatidylglycerol synthetase-like protein (DUF2156 family)